MKIITLLLRTSASVVLPNQVTRKENAKPAIARGNDTRNVVLIIALALVMALIPRARAGLGIPYTQDAHTMHLWHLNDTNGLFAVDSATNLVVDAATPI